MLTKIIEQLKKGKIKRVYPYGFKRDPGTPYIVVKPEKDPLLRGRVFKIIIHFDPGQNILLEDYTRKDVPTLLNEFTTTTRNGNILRLERTEDYEDIIIGNDDGTIAMECSFLQPGMLF